MRKHAWWISFLVIFSLILFSACESKLSKQLKEEKIAKVYCSSCHEFPEAGLLPKNIWLENVLPEMGLRLGIGDKNTVLTKMSLKLFDQLNNLGVYPNNNMISDEDWKSILHYYETNAPLKLPEIRNEPVTNDIGHFQKEFFFADSGQSAQTTMVKFEPTQNEIWLANANKELKKYSYNGKIKNIIRTPSPVVDVITQDETLYLSIGNMKPNEDYNGRIFHMNDQGTKGKLYVDSLHRPVQMVKADINADSIMDLIILEFGYITGQVKWVDGKSGVVHVISKHPGARNIHISDVDKDGYPDLLILFTQAKEEVTLFHNIHSERFEEKAILRFPSVYGSSYMDIADINGDGYDDLIISFGDNADYSIINKYYHGVGIYLNDRKNNYTKAWFYPSYGATKTIAADFDNDGDLDMAMIGFFSNKENGNSFLYFEQKKNMNFTVSNLNVDKSQWLVMDVNDMDKDGDQDIILGNFRMSDDEKYKEKREIEMLLLRNMLKKNGKTH